MKVTYAILLLALIGSVNAHADLGKMNCQAALDGQTADKKARTNVRVAQVEGKPVPQSTAPESTGKSTSGR